LKRIVNNFQKKFLYSIDVEATVPLNFSDDEGRQEKTGSRSEKPDDKDQQTEHSDPNTKLGIFRRRKKNKDGHPAPDPFQKETPEGSTTAASQDSEVTEKILDATKALEELRRLGLEPASLKEFTISLHKLAVASGVSPNVLASVIKEVSDLCEGKKISLIQARKQIEQLRLHNDAILKEAEDVKKKKQSLEVDLRLKELEYSASIQTLSEYARIKKELAEHGLSFADISKLVTLINNAAEQAGPDSSVIVETLADLKSKQDKRKEIETEIENLINTKRTLQDRLLTLEQEISTRQQILNSADEVKKLGFDFKELDKLKTAIKMIAQTRNIDVASAKDHLLSDLEGYYADDHELRKRIRILESLLQEKEDKFKMLEEDYQNEKVILDNVKKLISDGFDRQWIEKLQMLIDAYGANLDLLSEELKQHQGLKASINELQQKKRTLEEEERLIRQKVVAVEDQRIRTLSLIKDMMMLKSSASIQTHQPKEGELSELIRAAQGDDIIDEGKFKMSARKAIDIICSRLPKNSPARVVLEHARLALQFEDERNRRSQGSQ
jgi:hypothetical protein